MNRIGKCFLLTFILTTEASYAQVTPPEITKVVTAAPRTEPWKGWGKYSEPNPEGPGNLPVREKFTRTKIKTGQPREFSGKVQGLTSFAGTQVGLVSTVGVWWLDDAAYEWAPVQPDGSFSITVKNYPDAEKALCLRAPNRPWTFLKANFPKGEAASDIILNAETGKRVRLSARFADGKPLRFLFVEPFEAYRSFDSTNQPLAKQRYGRFTAQDGDIFLTLPHEPVALVLGGGEAASFYAIIDPTEADHFDFVFLPAARLKGKETRDGQPLAKTQVRLFNDAEPLSVRTQTTNDAGEWQQGNLPPGEWTVTVGNTTRTVTLGIGETKDLNVTPNTTDTLKTIPATAYFYAERRVKLAEISKAADELINPLFDALKANALEASGPIELHYLNMDGNPEHPFTLHLAIPVKAAKAVTGDFKIKQSPAFKCLSTTYIGAMSGLPAAWDQAIRRVNTIGHNMSEEGREIYWKFTAPEAVDNSTEILIGLR